MKRILTAIFLSVSLPAAAIAGSHTSQLVQYVQKGIAEYGITTDISGLSNTAIAQLKGIIDRKQNSGKREAIRAVLRNNGLSG